MNSTFYMLLSTKKGVKINFEKERLNFLNMERKINKRKKDEIIRIVWKILKNQTIVTILIVSHLCSFS